MALTDKQEQFARLVASGVDELDAIKQVGYKATGASKQAYRMAQNKQVQNRIAELKALNHIQAYDQAHNQPLASTSKPDDPIRPSHDDRVGKRLKALEFLSEVYTNPKNAMKERIQAAVAALPYEEAKIAAKGKKEDAKDTAKAATTTGKFATFSHQSDMFN